MPFTEHAVCPRGQRPLTTLRESLFLKTELPWSGGGRAKSKERLTTFQRASSWSARTSLRGKAKRGSCRNSRLDEGQQVQPKSHPPGEFINSDLQLCRSQAGGSISRGIGLSFTAVHPEKATFCGTLSICSCIPPPG